jgi:hypothetical protein
LDQQLEPARGIELSGYKSLADALVAFQVDSVDWSIGLVWESRGTGQAGRFDDVDPCDGSGGAAGRMERLANYYFEFATDGVNPFAHGMERIRCGRRPHGDVEW